MSRRETVLVVLAGGAAIVLATIFLPIFFSVVAIVTLIWFVIARGNGYKIPSYIALLLGVILLLTIYPFDQSKGASEESAKQLAFASGSVERGKEVIIQRLDGEDSDAVFLLANPGRGEVFLARSRTMSGKTYLLSEVNQKTGEKRYDLAVIESKQNRFMLSDFKESFPLKYGAAFILALLPLLFVSALPGIKKMGNRTVFSSQDGSFMSWILPSGPGEDSQGSVGAAGTQVILLLAIVMAAAFVFSMPSAGYLF